MKRFLIGPNDAGQRLDKFVAKAAPLLPQALMYKYIRIKRIKVDGKRAQISTRLTAGSEVAMYINDEFFRPAPEQYDFLAASKNLDILYEDDNILLLDKKAGVLSHAGDGEYGNVYSKRTRAGVRSRKRAIRLCAGVVSLSSEAGQAHMRTSHCGVLAGYGESDRLLRRQLRNA